jgi:hypothetical protein
MGEPNAAVATKHPPGEVLVATEKSVSATAPTGWLAPAFEK